jgi:hypothetical protein
VFIVKNLIGPVGVAYRAQRHDDKTDVVTYGVFERLFSRQGGQLVTLEKRCGYRITLPVECIDRITE